MLTFFFFFLWLEYPFHTGKLVSFQTNTGNIYKKTLFIWLIDILYTELCKGFMNVTLVIKCITMLFFKAIIVSIYNLTI